MYTNLMNLYISIRNFFRLVLSFDIWIVSVALCMILFSLMFVTSAGTVVALKHQWSQYVFLKRHLFYSVLGLLVMFGCAVMDKKHILNLALLFLVLGAIGVILTFFIGVQIKGAYRWLNILGISWQPSETMKLGCIILGARFIADEQYKATLVLFSVCMGLLLMQPDFGSVILLGFIGLLMAFLVGMRLVYFSVAGGALGLTGILAYFTLPHVFKRVQIFMSKTEDKFGSSYQIIRARQAFQSGGIFGKGPGEGIIKHYLPDANTDFIFAVIGEEFGILGCAFIMTLYMILLYRIFLHIYHGMELFYQLVLMGIGGFLLAQAWLNMLSVLSLIPTKGFSLPIIGYGGSALIMNVCAVGMILNLTRYKMNEGLMRRLY